MIRAGEPTGSKYGCPAAQFANSTGCGRSTGLPSPCSIAPSPSSSSSLAGHRVCGRARRRRWRCCGVPDVRFCRLRYGPRTPPRLRPRPLGSIPPLANESAVSRHREDQVHSVLNSVVERPIGVIRREYPDPPPPLMGPPATQVECIKSPAHNGAAAQGLLAQMLRILLHARNYAPKRSPCIFSVLAGIHCEYSLALALEDRIVAHHNFEAPEMLPSGTLHGRLGCDNLQAGAGAAPAPDATPNTARLAGLGCATDRGRLDTLSSRPRARALTSINLACASVAVGP